MTTDNRDIAIIGMAGIYPGAPNVRTLWRNILNKVDSVSDAPPGWGADKKYDPDATTNDRTYCKRGGFVHEYAWFNPFDFGIMPGSIDGSDPAQFLSLRLAKEAMEDAGYHSRSFDRKNTDVIIGYSNSINRGQGNGMVHGIIVDEILQLLRDLYPSIAESTLQEIKTEIKNSLPLFNADTCPGLVSNILTGRIANRLDLQGANFGVDAACASSLIALEMGMDRLVSGKSSMALVGGIQVPTPSVAFIVFCLLGALSRKGAIKPFDREADGTLLGEGLGMIVIKRREDAERDNDRIYALIKSTGISSDGKAQAPLVPRLEGEILAMERAYAISGISPDTVSLVEAHGTATKVGDATEIEALTGIFGAKDGVCPTIALGTVKSMISHTIPASGMAGIMKSALALYHKVLPPTICNNPNPELRLETTKLYLNTETRPWIHGAKHPRRAGVNAFGFGGINTHALLEEYTGSGSGPIRQARLSEWDAELLLFSGGSRDELAAKLERVAAYLSVFPDTLPATIAASLHREEKGPAAERTCALVCTDAADAQKKLEQMRSFLAGSGERLWDRNGCYYTESPLGKTAKTAFLFPGEGSQYVNMLSSMCTAFPEIRELYDFADSVFNKYDKCPLLSQVIFPPPHVSDDVSKLLETSLWKMEYAVINMFVANGGLFRVLQSLNIKPDLLLGHSVGQESAMGAAGVFGSHGYKHYYSKWLSNYKLIQPAATAIPSAKLLAIGAIDPSVVHDVVNAGTGVLFLSMDNCPNQQIVCGAEEDVHWVNRILTEKGAICNYLPFDRGYHSSLYDEICKTIERVVTEDEYHVPTIPILSCTTADYLTDDIAQIKRVAVDQWKKPVRFRECVEKAYADGVRIFLEVGPKNNLTGFVDDTLGARPHAALSCDSHARTGVAHFLNTLAQMAAHHVAMDCSSLYENRETGSGDFDKRDDSAVKKERARRILLDLNPPTIRIKNVAAVFPQPGCANLPPAESGETPPVLSRRSDGTQVVRKNTGAHDLTVVSSAGSARALTAPEGWSTPRSRCSTMDTFFTAQQRIAKTALYSTRKHDALIRAPWRLPLLEVPGAEDLRLCICVRGTLRLDDHLIAREILSSVELPLWETMRVAHPEVRSRWLTGRIAAKDAASLMLRDHGAVCFSHKEIAVCRDEKGRPYFAPGSTAAAVFSSSALSISHTGPISAALVSSIPDTRVGIDIERIDTNHNGLAEGAFSEGEMAHIRAVAPGNREATLLMAWCAKEACAKALGTGLQGDPRLFTLSSIEGNVMRVTINEIIRTTAGIAVEGPVTVYTGRDNRLVYALTLWTM